MILADKITEQRKKTGLSQEELADRLGVSRQAVSKWEGAQSVPDLARILELARLFGVSTDYLLKDEMGQAEYVDTDDDVEPVRRVSMAEAAGFLELKQRLSVRVSTGVLMCILSPVCLLLLGAASEAKLFHIGETAASGIGIIVMLLLVAAAVAIFISCDVMARPYSYLEREAFETEYGVTGMVRERQKQYQSTHTWKMIAGVCACILSVVPLLAASFLTEDTFIMVSMTAVLLLFVAVGVFQLVSTGVYWESLEQLLQEGDYSKKKKRNGELTEAVSGIYWTLTVAGYLAYSFITGAWDKSWIVWPVAGVLYAAVATVCGVLDGRKKG